MGKRKKILLCMFLLIAILVISLLPMVINILINIRSSRCWYILPWEANDILTYYASILSFVSTSLLGAIAFWQSISAERRSMLSENRIIIYIERTNKATITATKIIDGISIKMVLNTISNLPPTDTIVNKISIQIGRNYNEKIELSRKDVVGRIRLISDTQLELLIDFPFKFYDDFFDEEEICCARLGLVAESEYIQKNSVYIDLDIGFLNGEVVTTTRMLVTLEPSMESILADRDSLERACLYSISKANCFVGKTYFGSNIK